MGTCNCGDRSTEPEQVVDGLGKLPAQQTQIAAEEPEIEYLQSQNTNEPLYSTADIVQVQTLIRQYLTRKKVRRLEEEMIELEDDPEALPDECSDYEVVNFLQLLSEEARATYMRISRLSLEKQIKGVVTLPPKRLVENGAIYIGQWSSRSDSKMIRKGKGKLITSEGALFEGYWCSSHLHIKGRIIYHNGDYYEGPFKHGQREGLGRFETYERKTIYQGSWKDDSRHGYGIETFEDGARYEGSFCDDKKKGHGKFTWKDGSNYEGDFVEGRLEGFGTYKWYDKREYTGTWKDGKMHGRGKFTYKDGKTYEGDYVNDKKHGKGVYEWGDQKYEGDWVNGKMHGFGYLTTEKGRKRYQFENGSKVRETPE